MAYVNPKEFSLDIDGKKITILGRDPVGMKDVPLAYNDLDSLGVAAATEILTNSGKTGEVQILSPGTKSDALVASLDQQALQGLTNPQIVKSVARMLNLHNGSARVSLHNQPYPQVTGGPVVESGMIQVDFGSGSLVGYLVLMSYLKRFGPHGILVTSPSFPGPRGVVSATTLTLEIVVDGKTFGLKVASGVVTISGTPV